MPRRMSCALTIPAVKARTKTVTRRDPGTWRGLAPGDRLTLVEKAMGLPKGATQVVLDEVEVVSNTVELITDITPSDIVAEGVHTTSTPEEWVVWWCREHGYWIDTMDEAIGLECRRIEWRYL